MPKGVRIHHLFVQTIFIGIVFELLRNATGCNPFSIAIQKQIARGTVCFLQPFKRFRPQLFGYV